jgi:hypothetical protein
VQPGDAGHDSTPQVRKSLSDRRSAGGAEALTGERGAVRCRWAAGWFVPRAILVVVLFEWLSMPKAIAQEAELRAQVESLKQEVDTLRSQMGALRALVEKLQGAAAPATATAPGAAATPGAAAPSATAAVPSPAAPPAVAGAPPAGAASGGPASLAAAEPSAKVPEESATTFGGYGEFTYNNYLKDSSRNSADLRRFVLLLGHRFSDQLVFNSEVEWEHAVTSDTDRGETEIEQAYLDYSVEPGLHVKTGLFLMPFGFLNTSHEPPTYYGVERNFVETVIIPSTWREGGVGVYGATEGGWDWDLGVTTSFDVAKFDDTSAPLASIHQELQLADAHDLASYGALNYRGVPGLTVGGALFYGDSGQGNADYLANNTLPNFAGIRAPITLWETHVRWQAAGFDLEALYTRGHIGDAGHIDDVLAAYNMANATDRAYVPAGFYGWLVQGAYTAWRHGDMTLSPFLRFEQYNTQSTMPAGFPTDSANADRVATVGLSFKPLPQVVFKADYQRFLDNAINNRFNLGMGYMF